MKQATDVKDNRFRLSGRDAAIYAVILLAFMIIASRLATLLHEALGHALPAVLSGGNCRGVTVSLFGGGAAHTTLPFPISLIRFAHDFGGIIVNLLTGWLALILVRRAKTILTSLFLALFALASILVGYAYLIAGLYYNVGDPSGWLPEGSVLVFLALIPAPLLAWRVIGVYLDLQEQVFPSRNFVERLIKTAATLGTAVGIYAVLFFATAQHLVALDAPQKDRDRAMSALMEQKRADLSRTIKSQLPDISHEELKRRMDEAEITISEEELPRRLPMLPVIALLYVAGGFGAIGKRGLIGGPSRVEQTFTFRQAVFWGGAAVILLGVLYGINGGL